MATWYENYLTSDHWRETRRRKFEDGNYTCARCGYTPKREAGESAGLHVHHLNYDRVHNESLEDLEILCGYCHAEEHGRTPGISRDRWTARFIDKTVVVSLDIDEIDFELAAWDEAQQKADLGV